MKRVLVLIAAAITLIGTECVMAQSRTSYFMEGSIYRNDFNPALVPTRGYVTLPGFGGIGVNATSNFMSIDNFLYQKNGEIVTAFHGAVSSQELYDKLPSLGKASLDFKMPIFGAGFYTGKMFWTFGLNVDVSSDMAMSMDLFKALKTLGNGVFDLGKTAIDMSAYMDAYVGTSLRLFDFLSVGVKAKFLMGIANAEANFTKLAAHVTPDNINAMMLGTMRANGIMIDKMPLQNATALPLMDMLRFTDPMYMLDNFKNFGAAFDVGAEVRLFDDHLKVSAAVTDLGFIKWSPSGHVAGVADGHFSFDGINFATAELETSGEIKMLTTDPLRNNGYTTMLNCALNVGAEYNILNNHIAFGLMSHTKFCKTMTLSELTASVNFRPLNWISATVSHTFLSGNRPGVLGFALNIHPRVVNLYVGADYVDMRYVKGPMGLPLPRYQQSLNLYAGISFNFARPKFMREDK